MYEQWEEDEEPLPVDELPPWHPDKPSPNIDFSDMSKFADPEDFVKASKKGQTVMLFVKVNYKADFLLIPFHENSNFAGCSSDHTKRS